MNHLQNAASPYLIQHAGNPVDWYPWCTEAFERAKAEDKPIFLSIGYSTCHWCHVMAHESFENETIADILNRYFISIKVDREERPDIDSIYMSVCQAFTGSGGWPTSVFLTPEQEPFFAGTYFPPTSRGRMIGFRELLEVIRQKWSDDRESLLSQADEILSILKQSTATQRNHTADLPETAAALYRRRFDRMNGGFGPAPKFPSPHNLLFLLARYRRENDEDCLEMAERTLLQMYRGGLFDHVGYGFRRYSTDERFLVPHFEKMLYDNALLILAYAEAYAVTGTRLYLDIAEKTAAYVLREMVSPCGGFYSAQDADSEGEEGKFYLLTPKEMIRLLGKRDGGAFIRRFGLTEAGNFEGRNIPNLLHADPEEDFPNEILQTVRAYRKKRCRLHLDDKILTAWNGLMIAAMCRLWRVSEKRQYLDAAERADRFIREQLSDGERLFVSCRDGRRGPAGFLDDYASCLFAQLALYDATLQQEYLDRAEQLCKKVLDDFQDERGGFYLCDVNGEKLILRPKETYDGAAPSGNSLMAWNLVRLSLILPEYEKAAESQLEFMSSEAAGYPIGYAMSLLAIMERQSPPPKLTVVPTEKIDREALIKSMPPETVILIQDGPKAEYPLKDGKTTYYLCRGHSCQPPANDISELKWQ